MLKISPHMLETAYEFLRSTPPFKAWRLPHADEIRFNVARDPGHVGWVTHGAGVVPAIHISEACVGHTSTLVQYMAHEMIHLAQWFKGETTKTQHNAAFNRRAKQVCKHHGWDPKLF